ncbi:molybdopterin-dependent oxidoreductase [Halostella sp. PRR32]|uniref:molybdopterin-dependent oxidoreductase n=1 Tax=Halostella sp. PRR32 TaxID=3098147 RepID=UPI002B1D8B20|nr:molybdopterin-dependent oxidoreductase [Halostella sp. PRR32]
MIDTLRDYRSAFALAGAGGLASVAGSYAATGFTPQFVGAATEEVLRDLSPDVLVAFAIEQLGDLGHQLLLVGAIATAIGLFALAGFAGIVAADRTGHALPGVAVGGGIALALSFTVGSPVLSAAATALPAAAVPVARRVSDGPAETSERRRAVLGSVGSLLGLAAAGTVIGTQRDTGIETEPLDEQAETEALLDTAEERSLDVAGIEGLVSDEFYEVDYSSFDPTVDQDDWELAVTGEVDEPFTLDFDDLRGRESEHRFVTLRCVGENLNGKKMDNALWTGTPVAPLIERAGPQGGCECVRLHAADDYYQVFPLSALQRGFLAYGMNGTELPKGHGHPVRTLIPGHWGEINVKWVTEIEVLDQEAEGYWEERGWHGTGPVETVAKLYDEGVEHKDDGNVRLAGHAYAGTRGVQTVEVSTDGGDTWAEAALSEPLPGDDVWRQWSHEFTPSGTHEVVVRAVDGNGDVQPEERSDSYPSGPTGWVSRTVEG